MAIEENPLFQGTRAKEIWETLSKIDVGVHIEKKGKLSYLSWPWALGTLYDHYPQAEFSFREWDENPACIYPDGSATVECTISIGDVSRTCWLPVMDFKNDAVKNPNSREISDSRMRCLVKCIALFGLGLYIYAGEDLPPSDDKGSRKPNSKGNGKPNSKGKANPSKEDKTPVEEPGEGVVNSYREFMKNPKTMEELGHFYKENETALEVLKITEPSTYREIMESFTKRRKELEKIEKNQSQTAEEF